VGCRSRPIPLRNRGGRKRFSRTRSGMSTRSSSRRRDSAGN
jgi:hypothetical protein